MSESVFEDIDDVLPPEPNGEIVHWMEPRPLRLGPTGISLATASAFALGALTTVAVLGLMHWLGPQREPPRMPLGGLPLRFRRRAD
jgi:hypothetical protein